MLIYTYGPKDFYIFCGNISSRKSKGMSLIPIKRYYLMPSIGLCVGIMSVKYASNVTLKLTISLEIEYDLKAFVDLKHRRHQCD